MANYSYKHFPLRPTR